MFNLVKTARRATLAALVAVTSITGIASAEASDFAALGGATTEIMTETALDDVTGKNFIPGFGWNHGLPAGMPDFTSFNTPQAQMSMNVLPFAQQQLGQILNNRQTARLNGQFVAPLQGPSAAQLSFGNAQVGNAFDNAFASVQQGSAINQFGVDAFVQTGIHHRGNFFNPNSNQMIFNAPLGLSTGFNNSGFHQTWPGTTAPFGSGFFF
jgi:hypothetical protein